NRVGGDTRLEPGDFIGVVNHQSLGAVESGFALFAFDVEIVLWNLGRSRSNGGHGERLVVVAHELTVRVRYAKLGPLGKSLVQRKKSRIIGRIGRGGNEYARPEVGIEAACLSTGNRWRRRIGRCSQTVGDTQPRPNLGRLRISQNRRIRLELINPMPPK